MKVSQVRPRSRRVLDRSLLVLGTITLAAGLGAMTLAPGLSAASSHREAPLIAGDPRADNTDVYAFTSPDKSDTVTMVANWIPMEEPNGGPNFYAFGDDLRHNIKIDNTGDGVADVTYSWRFRSSYRDDANQFLYNTGQVTSLNDPDLNFRQVYDLVVTTGGKSRTPAAPVRIRIPAIGLDQPLIGLRVQQDGRLGVPDEPETIGWWSDGPRPGALGAAVVVGHVDSAIGPGAFHGLSMLDPGDKVSLVRDDRSTVTFTIRALRQYEKDVFPDSQVYATSGPPSLHLITCSGAYDRSRGEYRDNLVVYASLDKVSSRTE